MRLHTLMQMLRFKRPMGSRTEQHFRNYFLHSLKDCWEDDAGNLHVLIARKDRKWPKVIWSSHTDTVHKKEGFQKILLHKGIIGLATGETSNCLGADCTIGVWIMREMIQAKIPGHYVFHWGEERGCIGSTKIVKEHPEYFKRAKAIIAFDRRDDCDVITHQRGQRMCSDTFAQSLAAMMPLGYEPSDKGVYTDSAEYHKIIPECTNLSVGYSHEHSSDETVDLSTVVKLLHKILTFWDEDNLIIERDPRGPAEYKTYKTSSKYSGFEHYSFYDSAPALPYRERDMPMVIKSASGAYEIRPDGKVMEYASEQARLQHKLRTMDEEKTKVAASVPTWTRDDKGQIIVIHPHRESAQ